MKQNERILVYLVTGFLAVILVVAVFFGRDSGAATKPGANGAGADGDGVRGLGQMLDQRRVDERQAALTNEGGQGGEGASNDGSAGVGDVMNGATRQGGATQQDRAETQSPLVATVPVPATQRVQQLLGESRRDRTVRIVRARAGDSLESLVRRWCGKRGPFLDEAKALNEQLTVLRIGQEVVVPWVDDEVVLAAYEARQPRLLAGDGSAAGGATPQPGYQPGYQPSGTPATVLGPNTSPATRGPSFQVPGARPLGGENRAANANAPAAAAATVSYTVQSGDSLWKIAARRYGARNADRMIRAIKELNGLSSDTLREDQKLLLPTTAGE